MFGFSLAELIVVLLVILIFVKPTDLPEIAHFLGKVFYRVKHFYYEIKSSLKSMESELGVDDLRHELNRGIAEEKAKLEEDVTIIVDMHGNEHRVPNIDQIRPDLSKEDLKKEITEENEKNKKPASAK